MQKLTIDCIANLATLKPDKILIAVDKFRVLANYLLPWAIQDISVSKEFNQAMIRSIIRPASAYMRTMNAELQKFTDDEWTVFIWKLKDMINGVEWMDDIAACQAAENKMINAYLDVVGPTPETSDYSWIRQNTTSLFDVSQTMAEWFNSDMPGLAQTPTKLPPIDPDAFGVYPHLGDVPEEWTKYTRDRGTWLFGIGGLDWWKNYLNIDLVMYRLVNLRKTAVTGVAEVNAALARIGIPKGVRTILMATGVGMAGAGLAWNAGLLAALAGTEAPLSLNTGISYIGSRVGPFIWNSWPVVQGAVIRLASTQLIKSVIAGASTKALSKAALGFVGSIVFAQFILEETMQQYSFAISKLYAFQHEKVKETTDKIRETLDSRWKTWVPIYGGFWSMEKYFESVRVYCDIMDTRAAIQKAKALKRKESTIGEEE
jgi:hypothetical protein